MDGFLQSHSDTQDPAYRLCVGIMLVNKEGKIFVGNRTDKKGWQMPQGGVDRLALKLDGHSDAHPDSNLGADSKSEDLTKTAWRELGEEVGTQNCQLLGSTKDFYFYDFPKDLLSSWSLWRLRFRGQKQKWFVFLFCGQDTDINLCASPHQEFLEWKWVSKQDLKDYTPPFKKHVYEGVVQELWPCVEAALAYPTSCNQK
jgi:putative (di)nucleoside polyphosphate hydrolase